MAAAAALEAVIRERDMLSTALRIEIDTSLPGGIETATPAVTLDPTAERIGGLLDRLDKAITFRDAVLNQRALDGKRERSNTIPPGFRAEGIFQIIKRSTDPLTGLEYLPGTLVDSSLISPSLLARLYMTKSVGYVDATRAA